MDYELATYLRNIAPFASLEPHLFDALYKSSVVQHKKKGQMLCLAGESATNLFVVMNGWIKLFRETMDGSEAVLDVVGRGTYFGEGAIFDDGLNTHSAEVVEEAEIIVIPIQQFKECLDSSPDFSRALLAVMARQRAHKDHEVEHLSVQSASQRIGCYLLRLAGAVAQDKAEMELPYDKTLIAARLGMQPETFSRALGKLKIETGVQIKGSKVQIDNIDKLSSYSCAACASEFPCHDLKKGSCQ